jgi:serine/threonine protein kinase
MAGGRRSTRRHHHEAAEDDDEGILMRSATVEGGMIPLLSREIAASYEPLGVLGYGAFAMVIKARDRKSGRLVAIKHFHIKGLRHDHIVECLDVCDADDDSSDLIFEFATDGSLRDQMEQGTPTAPALVVERMIEVARGLAYAHQQGIVHRDLKPENILVFARPDGRRVHKIADFGIAKFVGMQSHTMTSIGSPAYMAPEQFYDQYGLRTDVYALGIMMFEQLHGSLPYEGSPADVFKGHLEKPLEFAADIPESLADIVRRFAAKKAEDRPDAEAALRMLETAARGLGIAVGAAPAGRNTAKASDRATSKAASSFFNDMFGGADEKRERDADLSISEAETAHTIEADTVQGVGNPDETTTASRPAAGRTPPVLDEDESALFDFLDKPFRATMEEASQPSEPVEQVVAMEPAAVSPLPAEPEVKSRDAFFSEGFDDEGPSEVVVKQNLAELDARTSQEVGTLFLTRQWSRTVDTASVRLVNMDDGGDLLVVTKKNIHQLKKQGLRGPVVYTGSPSLIGTPSRGRLPFVENGVIRLLNTDGPGEQNWQLEGEIEQISFAPDLSAIALTIGRNVCYHDGEANQLWVARLDAGASEFFIGFDPEGRLMLVSMDSEDQAVHFYTNEGRDVGDHWMPGRIIGASRCRNAAGAWVLVQKRGACQLFRVAAEGIHPYAKTGVAIRRLIAGNGWVCGVNEEQQLVVVDAGTGAHAVVPTEGDILDYEVGVTPDLLYVLEGRGEILKYVTSFQISISGKGASR